MFFVTCINGVVIAEQRGANGKVAVRAVGHAHRGATLRDQIVHLDVVQTCAAHRGSRRGKGYTISGLIIHNVQSVLE